MIYILASASPRRRELIGLLGLTWQIQVADVDEDSVHDPDPAVDVVETAHLKALAVAAQITEAAIILAADTTVALGDRRLNKPADAAEAREMLILLRDRVHQVHTGIVLINTATGQMIRDVASVDVPMRAYSPAELAAYIASGDPLDKAGAYAIQHPDFQPVVGLAGCYSAVVGLPLCHVARALHRLDTQPNGQVAQACQAFHGYVCPVYPAILAGLGPPGA